MDNQVCQLTGLTILPATSDRVCLVTGVGNIFGFGEDEAGALNGLPGRSVPVLDGNRP